MKFSEPPRSLWTFLVCVDVGFILYWLTSALRLLPPAWLYAHHDEPVMVDWNWSFLPLDLLVSATGLGALFLARQRDARWPLVAAVSLAFTSASGRNAIAFWALRADFDLSWWAPNIVLFVGPWLFIRGLWRSDAVAARVTAEPSSPP